MSNSISIRRIQNRLTEIFDGKILMSDTEYTLPNKFETRAIAALALMMQTDLDAANSAKHITDGFKDMGVDAIYLDEDQKKLFVVQSKWHNNGKKGVSQEEMLSFVEGIKRILELNLTGANDNIQKKSTDIDKALSQIGYQIHAIYIHTADQPMNKYVKKPINDLMKTTNDDVSTLLVFDEIYYPSIYSYLAHGQEIDSVDLDDVILNNWGKIDSPHCAYYGLISASAIGEWYNKYGNRLFAKNIRFYKGRTEVNDGIKNVLLKEPENFVYYNNGIKLLCKNITRKAKDSTNHNTGLFALEGVSLVNGAQTTGSIGSIFLEKPEQLSKAFVMIQIIDLSGASEEAAVQITKLSNTQNKIESKDFVTLDPEQERIRSELAFSHYTYLYKSGDKLSDPNTQVCLDEALVALACVNDDIGFSTLAKRNVGALAEDITKAPYKVLFNASTNSYLIVNSILILREVEQYLQAKKGVLVGKEKLVCIHGNRFIAHHVLQTLKSESRFSAEVIKKENFRIQITSLIDKAISDIAFYIAELYSESYPANIFKNITKCTEIRKKMLEQNQE